MRPRPAVVPERDALLRLNDFYEFYEKADPYAAKQEGARCMKCGAAFCMPDSGYGQGCPIYNKIPEWNELVRLDRWREAYERLSQTNPFPEFTSRVCPAPCQDACILGINEQSVQIKGIERAIADRAFDQGWVVPQRTAPRTGKRIAVVGSGPAGLSAAHHLNALGHEVTVYERNDVPGGLLRYGVPNMKLDKGVLDRRIDLMRAAGIGFELNCSIGENITAEYLSENHDAIILACGAMKARDIKLPGRELAGIFQAIPYLTASMRAQTSGDGPSINANGKRVVIIGAGDTGADCIATAMRQGAKSVINLANSPMPPGQRDRDHPWPGPQGTLRTDYAHKEAAAAHGSDPRWWQATTTRFIESQTSPGHVGGLEFDLPEKRSEKIDADLVILSVGFTGHDSGDLIKALEPVTATTPVILAGDMARGPSLVVHAIAEGRRAADKLSAML